VTEEKQPHRLSTNPATTFGRGASGGEYVEEDSWSDYVVNGQLVPEKALLLQSQVGPTDFPLIVQSILELAKEDEA
jgi:hypothetical protein